MKKTWMICLFAAVLAVSGCGKKEEASETEQDSAMVSIAATDFTQAQAEDLLKQEVKTYCGSQLACKVTSVKIAGKDINGTYTYEQDGKTMEATVTLLDVAVNKKDPNIYTIADKQFSSPAAAKETASDKTADPNSNNSSNSNKDKETKDKDKDKDTKENEAGIPKLPLPDKKLDPENPEDTEYKTVLETDDYYVFRIYLYTEGTLHVTGHYEGTGLFRVVVLNEDQTVAKDLIHATKTEELDYSVKLKAGFYYIYAASDGGSWNLEYKTEY
ncbi:MAG: hypothetical protein IJH14_01055 [Solobacterium sp.]|nr:hypothetical protein [Solobacterium sp.]